MKTKLTNILRENEIKKDSYAKLNIDQMKRINCEGKRTIGKANKGINIEKCNRFEEIKN